MPKVSGWCQVSASFPPDKRCILIPVNSTCLPVGDRKSTRLNSSHANISYAVFCLKKKKETASDRGSKAVAQKAETGDQDVTTHTADDSHSSGYPRADRPTSVSDHSTNELTHDSKS